MEVRCEKLRVKLAGLLLSLIFPLFPPPPHARVFMKNPLCGSLGREKVSRLSPFKAGKLRDWRKNSVCLAGDFLFRPYKNTMNWVLYNRNVFLTALEAGSLRLGCQQGACEGHTQFADFSFCPHKAEGAAGSCWSLFYKDINLMMALPSSPHHPHKGLTS